MVELKDLLHNDISNQESVTMLGEDIIILDRPKFTSSGHFPYKNEWLIATLCEKGSASGTVNLRDYHIKAGGFIVILPGQVVVKSELSEDFQGKIVLISSRIAESLNLRLMARAFFLGETPLVSTADAKGMGPYSKLTEDYLSLVEKEYRNSRQIGWYAEKLGRNEKYLSRHIKEETGRNASEWIERCVILDAQAQLSDTRKTIAEISDSLGFPSQSFFGKYFKRVTGLTPKEFRNNPK